MSHVHLVIMGGGGVGKSALTAQFVRNTFVSTYDPTMEDSYSKSVVVDHQPCLVELVDTAGTEQFLALKDLHIRKGQGFLLVFSLTQLASVNELGPLWDTIRRIKQDGSHSAIPVVLVGNKSDLRSERQVPREIGTNLSKAWGDIPYYETSARKRVNVDQIFADLIRQIRATMPSSSANGLARTSKRAAANVDKRSTSLLSAAVNPHAKDDGRGRCVLM